MKVSKIIERIENSDIALTEGDMGRSGPAGAYGRLNDQLQTGTALQLVKKLDSDIEALLDAWVAKKSGTLARMLPSVLNGKANDLRKIADLLDKVSKKARTHNQKKKIGEDEQD